MVSFNIVKIDPFCTYIPTPLALFTTFPPFKFITTLSLPYISELILLFFIFNVVLYKFISLFNVKLFAFIVPLFEYM